MSIIQETILVVTSVVIQCTQWATTEIYCWFLSMLPGMVSIEKTVDKMQVSRELECYVILRTNPLKHLVHDLATTHGVASLYRTKGLDRSV